MREFEDLSARPVLRTFGGEPMAPEPRTLGELTRAVSPGREGDMELREWILTRDGPAPERIPSRALTTPLVGRRGRKAVYMKHQKATTSFNVSEELKGWLVTARLPSEDSIEDTIRRLCGFAPRTVL